MEYELKTGWLTLFYQPVKCVGDTDDNPLQNDPDVMMMEETFSLPQNYPFLIPYSRVRAFQLFDGGDSHDGLIILSADL